MNNTEVREILLSAREMLQDHWTTGTYLSPIEGYWGATEGVIPSALFDVAYPAMCSVGGLRVATLNKGQPIDNEGLMKLIQSVAIHDDNWKIFYRPPYRDAVICLVKSLPDAAFEFINPDLAPAITFAHNSDRWDDIPTRALEDIIINWNDSLDTEWNGRDALAKVLAVFDEAISLAEAPEPEPEPEQPEPEPVEKPDANRVLVGV
jgi:hypothetical protein